jgi:Na+-transporting NADH:ubiquinone oxidoreductase subunit NqrC
MKQILILSIFFSISVWGANRPYTEVVTEIAPKSCKLKKENLYLDKKQQLIIEKISGVKLYGRLALRYVCPKEKIYYYIDSHIVRTLNETVIVKIQDEKVTEYVVSSFNEPQEYKAPKKWLDQFIKKEHKKYLLRENIDALSGATLTAKASVDTVNKVLVLHKVISKN